jgi:hypothetical protein
MGRVGVGKPRVRRDKPRAVKLVDGPARLHRTLNCVADAEMRVASQQRLIRRLARRGLPTREAEELLRTFNMSLMQMRNHLELLQHLLSPPVGRR